MHISIERITPELAASFLRFNDQNRHLRKAYVKSLAGAMLRGEWKLTHQGIAFDTNGNLVDGQHRLSAIVASGMTVEMVVFRNVGADTFPDLDRGVRRSMSDNLRLDPKVSQPAAFIARVIAGHAHHTPEQVKVVYDQFRNELDSLSCIYGDAKVVGSAAFRAAAAVQMYRFKGHAESIKKLYSDLVTSNTADLPPIGHAIISQVLKGQVATTNTTDLFVRALQVFDPSKRDSVRVVVRDALSVIASIREDLEVNIG